MRNDDYESARYATVNSFDISDTVPEPDEYDGPDQIDDDPIEAARYSLFGLRHELSYTRKCLDRDQYQAYRADLLKHIEKIEALIAEIESGLEGGA